MNTEKFRKLEKKRISCKIAIAMRAASIAGHAALAGAVALAIGGFTNAAIATAVTAELVSAPQACLSLMQNVKTKKKVIRAKRNELKKGVRAETEEIRKTAGTNTAADDIVVVPL